MSTIEQATADPAALGTYEGEPILRTVVKITKAGDGLSKGMAIQPQKLQQRGRVRVLLDCVVDGHNHKPIDGIDWGQELIQTLVAGTAVIVDGDLVDELLAAEAERIRLAEEAAKGVARLEPPDGSALGTIPANNAGAEPDEMPDAEVLHTQHEAGVHADGIRTGCPDCDEEVATAMAEAHDAGQHDDVPGPVDGCPACQVAAGAEPTPPTPIGKASGRRSRAKDQG